jgi:membrane protease YdiL (CAAX protease family)
MQKPTHHKAFLFTSLGLIILGITLYIIYFKLYGNEGLSDDSFSKLTSAFPLYWAFMIIMVVAPIYEEVIFRLWVIGKHWAFWTTAILTAVLGWVFEAYSVVVIGLGLLLYLGLENMFKLTFRKGTTFFVLSSLSFAFLHLDSNNPQLFSAIQLMYYLGAGGLLAYVGLRYGFGYNVISHIIFNSAIALAAFFGGKQQDLNFTLDMDTEVSLTANAIFSIGSSSNVILNSDTVYFQGTLGSILISISPERREQILMVDNTFSFHKYTLLATSKTSEINLSNLRNALVEQLNIRFDTTEMDAFCLQYDELFEGVKPTNKNPKPISLKNMAYLLRTNHNQKLPVVSCDNSIENPDMLIPIDIDFYFIKSIPELETYLQNRNILLSAEPDTSLIRVEINDG